MKKQRKVKKLALSRETLTNLGHLEENRLGKIAGGSRPQQCTASTCANPRCTCPV